MSLTLPKTASFGGSHTGLVGTAGVAILNADGTVHTARTTAGIYEIGGGCYGKEVTFDDNFKGSLKWDTGGGTPVYAVEDYSYLENNPIVDDIYSRIGAPSGASIAVDIAGVPSDVWDEILTGATHNLPTSAGRRVREIGAFAIHSGTAQAGNSHSITLAAAADANDGVYNRNLMVLTDNAGVGQTRTIVDYDGTTKIVVVDRDWRVSPDATTSYQIVPDDTPLTVDHGVARGGTNRTITIRAYASSVDDAYLCNIVTIIAGKGRGQARLVGAYNGTTNVVTICGDDWVDTPDTTSVYVMMPYGVACAACVGSEALNAITDGVWDEDLSNHTVVRTAGKIMQQIKSVVNAIFGEVS